MQTYMILLASEFWNFGYLVPAFFLLYAVIVAGAVWFALWLTRDQPTGRQSPRSARAKPPE
jgi:hypothetical protein